METHPKLVHRNCGWTNLVGIDRLHGTASVVRVSAPSHLVPRCRKRGASISSKQVHSSSPGLSAKRSFHGLYLYNEGQVRLWPYPRANGEHTVTVLQRLRAEAAERKLIVLWDGASYHRAGIVRDAAAALDIQVLPLPGYSPDFMPVEALWRWLREDVTYHHCHASLDDLGARVAEFQDRINQDPIALADRLALKEHLNSTEEKLRISK